MDKLDTYRQILQSIVEKHAQYKISGDKLEAIPVCDTIHDNYMLLDIGWSKSGRVHGVVFHLRIRDGKIWVEEDGIEYGIAQDLLDAGIPKEDIVLAFYRPDRRALTDFAVA